MRKRFIVAAVMSPESEKKLVEYFRERRAGWWHRVANFWLVVTDTESLSAAEIRDKIRAIGGIGTSLVMEVHDDITWTGLMPTTKPDTFDWITSNWTGDP